MRGWEPVTAGHSGATVYRSPDGRRYAKCASTPPVLAELRDERDRLRWLDAVSIPAPRVLDWAERAGNGTLVTSAVRGVPASELSPAQAPTAARRLMDVLDTVHALPVSGCPFDRRLAVTVPLAAAHVAAGLVDEDDFDQERRGETADRLLARLVADRPLAETAESADLAVCHGDFCLPNVLLDPQTLAVTAILDAGRLGVADRHLDLALLTRSLASTELNPAYGPELAEWVTQRTGADPWRIEYYRLLDEFF